MGDVPQDTPKPRKKSKKSDGPLKKGWFIILPGREGTARVYAAHKGLDVILQAYMSLSEPTRSKAVLVHTQSPEEAIEYVTRAT